MRHFLLVAACLFLPAAGHAQAPLPTEQSVPRGQLSDAVTPQAYRLDLTIDPARERFSGKVEIDATLVRPSAAIFLHGRDLAMREAAAIVGGKRMAGTWQEVDPTGVAALRFAEPLPAGPVTLAFAYDAPFQTGPSGMFRVKVDQAWYSWSQFESIDARAAFPSFDQPSFKTPFTVTLRTPQGLTAVSNAPQISDAVEGGLTVHRFRQTLPLPTYLVAMMVGPFASVAGEVPPTPQRTTPLPLRVVSPQPNAPRLDFALQGSKQIVALLEDYFGDAFPYPKLDQITSPIMPGAMENAGADLYDDSLIVMDASAPTPQKRRFGMVVAHELAHQWFGDLVTPAWWDDIWLNESFANWMGYRIGDAWRPDLNIRSGAVAEGFAAMDTDSLVAGRPIRQTIASNDQIDGAFDSITYGKGGHVVAMIAGFMGDEPFRQGVRRYMAAHRYGNATSTDFFAAMAEAAHDPRIVPAMRSFTDQQGVPLLTFTRTTTGWSVAQSRYAPLGVSPPATQWSVPLCVRQGDTRQCILLTGREGAIASNGAGPLVPNAGGTGYYRFELDRKDWDALIANADGVSGTEAQAIADSLAASLGAGRADAAQLADLAARLVRHPDSYASDAATNALADLVMLGVVDEQGRAGFRRLVQRLYRPLLTQYGFDPRAGAYAGEDAERTQRRVQVVERLATAGRDGKLRRQLALAAKAFFAGQTQALDPAWYPLAFDIHLAKGRLPAARALMDQALASEDPLLRPAGLGAVAGSGSRSIAAWLLNDFKDARLRPSEQRDLLAGVILTASTKETGYAWLRDHLDELISGRGGIFYSSRLPQLLRRFCGTDRADDFARTLRPRFAGKSGALELERVIELIRNCGVLKEQRGEKLSAEFHRFR